jgi:hypothetical protein
VLEQLTKPHQPVKQVAHLDLAIEVLKYLQMHPDKRLTVCASPIKLPASAELMTKANQTTMRDLYPDAVDEVNPLFPPGRGEPMQTSVWFDSNHTHDKTMQKSIEGINTYLGRTLLKSKSK